MEAHLAGEAVYYMLVVFCAVRIVEISLDVRHDYKQLFIRTALQLGLVVHSLRPCLLAYLPAAVALILVEGLELAEVDLLV